jgi:hypothetical protein
MPGDLSPWGNRENRAFVVSSQKDAAGSWSPPYVMLRTSGSDPELAEQSLLQGIESIQRADLPMIPNQEGKLRDALDVWKTQNEGWR